MKSAINDAFASELLAEVSPAIFKPTAFHNVDGDCIEIFLSQDTYRANRLSEDLTALVSDERDGELVGLILKGVKSFLDDVKPNLPGLMIEIEENENIRLEYFINVVMWKRMNGKDQAVFKVLERIREVAGREKIELALKV